jgi:DNA polymerase Ligase (LigD)
MSSFIIGRHKTPSRHYDLLLEKNGEVRHWIVPKNVPKKYRERRIAIEERGAFDLPWRGGENKAEDSWGSGTWEIWDQGVFETEAANKIRLVIRAEGERFRGKFLLLAPGWGRWTAKRLWVIEKIREK